jgi:cell division septal protein FtsQ
VALVERADGFYTLAARGGLRGPISPAWQGDLPVLSGPGIENARAAQLLECAGILVRAEADLSEVVSEMWAGVDGRATLFLDRPRIEVTLDVDNSAVEIARAAKVLTLWRGHHDVIAALDLTTPGQAVVRFKPGAFENARRATGIRKVATAAPRRTSPPEVTASR